MQVELPVAHEVTPSLQTLGFVVQVLPAVQPTQVPPALQTKLVPHTVPASRNRFVELLQTEVPVPQPMTPKRHGFRFPVHVMPPSHVTHEPPPEHTCEAPHDVPASTFIPELLQTGEPVVHETMPMRQAFGLVEHEPPAMHEPQLPLLQV